MRKFISALFMLLSILFVFPSKTWSFSYDKSWYNNSKRVSYYEIKNASEYGGLIQLINIESISFASDTIAITSDLSLSGYESLNKFDGVLIGNNHIISNLTSPLVSTLESGSSIEGLIFDTSCYVSGGLDLGMVARVCNGSIKNCVNYGTVSLSYSDYISVGGICGNLKNGKILGCINKGNVSASIPGTNMTVLRTGGICGFMENKSTVIGCYNYGTISASSYAYAIAGGIIGDCQSNSSIENCTNKGKVISTLTGTSSLTSTRIIQFTGGIAGQAQFNSRLNLCSNYGAISNNTQYVSGIIGHAGKSSLYNCSNYGSVTSTENYFFSCACGICSYFDAVSIDNNKDFLNCVNTGTIISKTKNAIATAAGICNDIKYANVGNLLSFGSVSASATGTSSQTFPILQYETTDCNILSKISAFEEANSFIDKYKGEIQLVYWEQDENKNICLSNHFSYFIETYQGLAIVNCYSENIKDEYIIKYSANGIEYTNKFVSSTTLDGLTPNTNYQYILSESTSSSQINGTFTTQPINLKLTIDNVKYTIASATLDISARGVEIEEYGVIYRLTENKSWNYLKFNSKSMTLEALKDNAVYDVKPYVKYMSINHEGDFANFKTQELIPSIIQTEVKSSILFFKTLNIEDLTSFKYGITYEEKDFYANKDGRIIVDSLDYYRNHTLYSFIEKYGEKVLYKLGDFSMITFGTEEPIQLSPTSAMVRVLANAGKAEQGGNTYDNFAIEYRDINSPDNVSSNEIVPVKSDDYYEYSGTFNFDSKEIYQYRIKASTSRTYYGKYYYKYGDWIMVDGSKANNLVVKPIFVNFKTRNSSNTTTVSCVNIIGEESVSERGIAYKIKGNNEYIEIPLTENNGVLSRTFTSLVSNLDYIGHFYNKVDNNIYISSDFIFNSNGDLNITNKPNTPNPEDEKLYLSIIYPDAGKVIQEVKYYQNIDFKILPPEGWKINTIFIDDVDVTYQLNKNHILVGPITQNRELSISYETNNPNNIETLQSNEKLKIYSKEKYIFIPNLPSNATVSIFNIQGMKIYSGQETKIEVPSEGIYLVNINGITYKLYVGL